MGLTGGRQLFAYLAHYLLKGSFDANKRIRYLSLIASTEDMFPNPDYSKGQVLNPRPEGMPASFTSCEGSPLRDTAVHQSSASGWNSDSMGPKDTEEKTMNTGALKEPALLSKGPNLLLDLDRHGNFETGTLGDLKVN